MLCNMMIMITHHPESRVLGHLLPRPPIDTHLPVNTLLEEFPAAMFVNLSSFLQFMFEVTPVQVYDDVPAAVKLAIPLTLYITK